MRIAHHLCAFVYFATMLMVCVLVADTMDTVYLPYAYWSRTHTGQLREIFGGWTDGATLKTLPS
jgi:hypothetical protein